MKSAFLILSIVLLGFAAYAEDSTKTQAGWFGPDCKECPMYQTPGSANLGNSKGVFRPGKKSPKKPTTPQPVDTNQ